MSSKLRSSRESQCGFSLLAIAENACSSPNLLQDTAPQRYISTKIELKGLADLNTEHSQILCCRNFRIFRNGNIVYEDSILSSSRLNNDIGDLVRRIAA